jgi:hypothetical protein
LVSTVFYYEWTPALEELFDLRIFLSSIPTELSIFLVPRLC